LFWLDRLMVFFSDGTARLIDSFRLPLVRKAQEGLVWDFVGFSNKLRIEAGLPPKQFRRVNSQGIPEDFR
jgi:hypothetical protein